MERGGAGYLARIIGTEEDKVNCSFYYKIGACRHGDSCLKLHPNPEFSQTLLLSHLYVPPPPRPDGGFVDEKGTFTKFYEDIFTELSQYGPILELYVVDNLGDHLFGNTYVKFINPEHAVKAYEALSGRYYAGRLIDVSHSPVTDFGEARCRQFYEGYCARGNYCNFLHLKLVSKDVSNMVKDGVRHATGKDRRYEHRHRNERRARRSYSRDERILWLRASVERQDIIAVWNKERREKKRRKDRKERKERKDRHKMKKVEKEDDPEKKKRKSKKDKKDGGDKESGESEERRDKK